MRICPNATGEAWFNHRMPYLARAHALALVVLALVFAPALLAAEPLDRKDVPDPLKPWTDWALRDSASSLCPTLQGQKDATRCVWPSRLELSIDEKGGRFSQRWHVDAPGWVALPGDAKRWPLDVKVDGTSAVVITTAAAPSVRLALGDHVVTGTFAWDSPPESIHVPPETGLLALTLRGAVIAAPNRDASGSVFLQKTTSAEEGEKLEILAHRKITDDIPLTLTTHLELDVAGKSREVLLGKALPPGFVPMSLVSQLPARLEPDSRLRVQVRPGRYSIELVARSEAFVTKLARPTPDGPWREGEEVWTFEAKPDLRVVEVKGPPSIDPAQTSLPEAWKKLPAYPMKVGDELTLEERRRGDADPPPNQLTLHRTLWLDFDGGGYTISDSLSGTLNRDSRLEMDPPTTLGRVAIGGRDQFITHLGDPAHMGVEVRQGSLSVTADSRLVGNVANIPAVGWKHDFHQVSGTLHLPPGWRLFHASGVDEVPSTWLHQWSLLEIFLVLIVALAIGRLHGWRWAGVALVMLALTLPEDGAPKWSWLAVLGAEALVRVLPEGTFQKIARFTRGGLLVLVGLIAIPFLVQHVREGMYPVLADDSITVGSGEAVDQTAGDFEGGFGTRSKGEEGAMGATGGSDLKNDAPPQIQDKEQMQQSRLIPSATATSTAAPIPSDWGLSGSKRGASYQFNTETYDPNAVVQTGPGLPKWTWSTIPLTWSGPVAASQRLELWLVPPSANFALAFVRLLLLVLVLLRMIPQTARFWPSGWGPAAPPSAVAKVAALALLAGLALAPGAAHAEVPSQDVLNQLRDRLLAKPECLPSCAESGRLSLDVTEGALQGRLELDAAAQTAVPLPGNASQWLPEDVALDGQPAKALLRTNDGTLWLAVAPGPHQVTFQGRLPERDSVQLALPLKPHRVEVTAKAWSVAGVHEDGLADDNLQFTRTSGTSGGTALQPGSLPAFVRVERTIAVGLNWQVDTRVVRLTPPGTAVVLEVPLLTGESVTTADVRVVSGKAQVNIAPNATEMAWHSVLEQKSPLELVAPKNVTWTEVWRVDVGPIWHGTFSGIPAVHVPGSESGPRVPEWRPWPGERASVELSRPDGVAGQSLTIDSSRLDVKPGLRATDVTLTLVIRASRGATHVVTLPASAELESLTVNGATQPVRQEGGKVTLAIVPGAQTVVLTWRETPAVGVAYHTPTVDLGAPSVNATVSVDPGSRWILFVYGPRVGPAVLFWSMLLVLFVVAALLGRIKWTPLRFAQWSLLAIGLSQVPIVAGAVFAGWLVALGWRKERPNLSPGAFDTRQVLLVLWTFLALVVLAVSIHQGLLGTPEMQVRGNGSGFGSLSWFQDRSEAVLPTAFVLSVPMLAYRIAMLAWALWVALALLKWLKWGWGAFGEGGFWKSAAPRVAPSGGAVPGAGYGMAPGAGPMPTGVAPMGGPMAGAPSAWTAPPADVVEDAPTAPPPPVAGDVPTVAPPAAETPRRPIDPEDPEGDG